MIRAFKTARAAGWRAGMAGQRFEPQPDGTKRAVAPLADCPFKGNGLRASVLRLCWVEGWRAGVMESLDRWLNKNLPGRI